jgi:glycosyltransferase involved in cell wall biosynthesis
MRKQSNSLRLNLNLILDSKFLFGPINGISRDFNGISRSLINQFRNTSLLSHGLIDRKNHFGNLPIWKIVNYRINLIKILLGRRISIPNDSILFLAQPNILHIRFLGNKIFRIHDLFPVTNPEWFTVKARLQFRYAVSKFKVEDIFVCNSEETYKVFCSKFPHLRNTATIVHCATGMSETEKCGKCEICSSNILPTNFFLMVGTIEPRKDYITALKAWDASKDSRKIENLVIVGRRGWKNRKTLRMLRHYSTDHVIHYSNACDYALNLLYKESQCFLSTSLNEGFNIPLADAVSFHKPVILSDIQVHRDHSDGNATFFTPRNWSQLATLMSLSVDDLKSINSSVIPQIVSRQQINNLVNLIMKTYGQAKDLVSHEN